MWQFFSRDSSKDFPYEWSEESEYPDCHGFSLRAGNHKVTKDPVSVFSFSKKYGSNEQYEYAKASLKRLKTLRHPNILTFLDSQENDSSLLIVTEPVTPLLRYLSIITEGKGKQLYLSWGLMNIFKAVAFLNHDAKLKHNDIGIDAVFVNTAGEWKLGRVGKASEIEAKHSQNLDEFHVCPDDSLGLGILIWEVYNARLHDSISQLTNVSQIPSAIRRTYQELIASQEIKRPSASIVLEKGRKNGGFFQNDLVDAIVFLDEIHIKNKEEINLFFKNIQPLLADIPKCTAEFKILPQLIRAYEYGCEGTCVLPPLFEITNHISEKHFQSDVVPFLVKIFGSTDRATRSLLLANLEQYIDKVPSSVINESLFPQILNGFIDTNPRIREQTVKAMIHISPKLNDKNINNELMLRFARILHSDDQGGIRTNTVVCLTKIAYCLDPQKRRMILLSAFLRSLADPFPPVRNAGTLGLAVSQQYFALEDVSKKILPALCALTLDPEASVRESVFKTIKGFLSNLEKVSENPELKTQMEAEALSTSSKPASSWAAWATTAITSKFSLKMDRKPEPADYSEKPKDSNVKDIKVMNKNDSSMKILSEEPKLIEKVDPIHDPVVDRVSMDHLTDKMKYLADDVDNEFGWDGDSWEALEDEVVQEKLPERVVEPPRGRRLPKSDEERKKPKSGPMKLGTRLNQPKFD